MSMEYWAISGIGLEVTRFLPFISKDKLMNFLKDELPDDKQVRSLLQSQMFRVLPVSEIVRLELCSSIFDNPADMFTYCDDTNCLTYDGNGEGDWYLYYPPSMPWQLTENEPDSVEEVHHRIIAAISRLVDLALSEIESQIDDELNVIGCG